jgi:hypothetical protein
MAKYFMEAMPAPKPLLLEPTLSSLLHGIAHQMKPQQHFPKKTANESAGPVSGGRLCEEIFDEVRRHARHDRSDE